MQVKHLYMGIASFLLGAGSAFCASMTAASSYFRVDTISIRLSASDGAVPGGIEITWTDDGAAQYELFRGLAKDGPFNRIALVSTNAYFDSSAEWGNPYWYYVSPLATAKSVAPKGRGASNVDDGMAKSDGELPKIMEVDVGELWLTGEGPYYCFLKWNAFDADRYFVSSISFDLRKTSGSRVWNTVLPKFDLQQDSQIEIFDVSMSGRFIVPKGEHGQHSLRVTWEITDKLSGNVVEAALSSAECPDVKVFFHKFFDTKRAGPLSSDDLPNWYRYWKEDGAISNFYFKPFRYDTGFRYYAPKDMSGSESLKKLTRGFHLKKPWLKRVASSPDLKKFPEIAEISGACRHEYGVGIDAASSGDTIDRTTYPSYVGPQVGDGNAVGLKALAAVIAHERKHGEVASDLYGKHGELNGFLYIGTRKRNYGFKSILNLVDALVSSGYNGVFVAPNNKAYYNAVVAARDAGKYSPDFDGDGVSDPSENGSKYGHFGFSSTNPDTMNFAAFNPYYAQNGDNEVIARDAETKEAPRVDERKDWAFPGFQICSNWGWRENRNRAWMGWNYEKWRKYQDLSVAEVQKLSRHGRVDMSSSIERLHSSGRKAQAGNLSLDAVPKDDEDTVDEELLTASGHGTTDSLPVVFSQTGLVHVVSCSAFVPTRNASNRVESLSWSLVLTNETDEAMGVTVKGYLSDGVTNALAWASTNLECAVGLTTATISFQPEDIFLENPSWLTFHSVSIETAVGDMSSLVSEQMVETALPMMLSPTDLANDKARILSSSVEVGISPDGVTISGLVVRASCDAAEIYASLTDTNGLTVASVKTDVSGSGTNSFTLFFPGAELYQLARPLPYQIESLRVAENGKPAHEIALVGCVDVESVQWFCPSGLRVKAVADTGMWLEPFRGKDGLCNQIAYSFTVSNCADAVRTYHLRANLFGTNEVQVCSLSQPLTLMPGTTQVSVAFSSIDMASSAYDGDVYHIGDIFIESKEEEALEVMHTDGNSIAVPKDELGGIPFTVKGEPQYRMATEDSPAAVVVTVDVARPDTITATVLLVDGEGQYIATARTVVTVSATGERTLTLVFDPNEINASGRRGPYTISYLLLKSGIEGVEDIRVEDFEVRDVGDSVLKVFVDAATGDDANDGATTATAKRTIQAAVEAVEADGDRVVVADGVYEPFTCENKSIVIESVNGSRYTIIDGGGTNRCTTLGTSGGQTNTVLRGFTLRNGNANGSAVSTARTYGGGVYGGTLENCVVANCEAQCGGGVYDANLANCSIVGNRAGNANVRGYGGGVCWKTSGLSASDCYIADNRAYHGSAVYTADGVSATLSHSLVVRNTAQREASLYAQTEYGLRVADCTVAENNSTPAYRPGTWYVSSVNSIIHCNFTRRDVDDFSYNSSYGSVTNCCTTVEGSTCIGTGIVTEPPAFVDRAGRIYDLLSPCGENIVGAGRVVDTNGQFKVTVEIDGFGVVTRPGAVVAPGSAFELVAEETGRAFEGFYTNGVFATANRALELMDIQSDIRVTARFAKRTAYVAETGNDANDGLTYATAKRTIHAALPLVENGESIEVAPGTYAPIAPTGYASKGKSICIYSTHGAAQTAIDGGRTNRCADLSDYYSGTTNAVLRGFTLRNGYTTGSGGGAYFGTLIDCVVVGNEAVCSGGGAYLSRLENCVVARNKAGTDGGGLYSCTADRSTICGNEADGYGGGTYYGTLTNCIVYQNSAGTGGDNWYGGSFTVCCLSPSRGANPVLGDPLLVDGWNGDARLRVGSPCFVDGVQVCGADVGAPVEGVSVSVGVQGTGAVSNATFLVSNGDSVTIAADETERPFLYWDVDGEVVSNRVYTLTNVTADVRAVAVFDTFDWFVDARAGDDANDGFGWDTAKRTLQAAIDEAVDGETIYVEAGTYAPISTDNKRVRVESLYGAELTFLDGGGTDRCATLAIVGIQTNSVLVGFTLLNGQAQQYGGGSYGGTLDSCVISNCVTGKNVSYAYGGGAYGGALNNCLVVSNSATASYGAQGGGTYGARLRSCTIARNKAKGTSGWAQSGGVYGNGYSAYNTIIWGNEVVAPNARYPNADYANLYNCCTDDTVDRRFSGTITNDPQFVDADAGNFRLKAGSPCLNAGNNSYVQGETDLDWNDRIQDGRVDMGCYEGAAYDAPPGQVTGLCAVRGVLTWDALPDAEGYMIYRSTRRMASSAKYIGSSEANAYTDETAVEGTTYYYWVQAFNALGLGARSDLSENTWPVPLSVTTAELPEAMEKVAYAVRLEAAGGAAPYAWSCENGYVSSRTATTYAEVGTAQGWHADDNCWALALPFDFPFYGNTYRTVYVNSNGTITFGGRFSGYTYSLQNFTNRVMVAALWADLDTSGTGDIFVSERADAVTIRWMGRYQGGGEKDAVAVSATLSADGTVRLAYGAGNARGGFVGASAGEGERYLSLGDELDLNAASDIVLRDGAIGNGFALTEEGQIVGTPRTAGTNTFAVTVTDAAGETAKRELSLVVNENSNHRPVVESVSPTTNVNVKAGSLATFAVAANDPEGEPLTYVWYLDGEAVECSEAQFTFAPTVNDAGSHVLRCVVSDGFWTNDVWRTWSFRVVRDWYVNAATEEGVGDGSSADSALQSIAEAVEGARDGDTIYVAPGRYDEIIHFNGAVISIVATGGAQCTFILGNCYGGGGWWSPYSNNDVRQLSLDGFTMMGCELDAVTLRNCIVTSDAQSRPAYAFGCRLFDCVVTGNVCGDAILWQCELTRCTVAGNTVGEDGAVGDSSRVYDSIVWGNVTADGVTANYDDVQFENSCTWPMPVDGAGAGIITNDPRLVDAANGDMRVRIGSPCLDTDGVQTMGANVGNPVEGLVLSVQITGNGVVSPLTAVVPTGGTATFEVANGPRPFLGFATNGVFATSDAMFVWPNVTADGIVTATFSNFTFHVDAATGNDAASGLSWETPKVSIQSAINAAQRGETILVKPGRYAPITTEDHASMLRIVGIGGKAVTVLDGGGVTRCAYLGDDEATDSTLIGFTITNGFSETQWTFGGDGRVVIYDGGGGGVNGGIVEDCDIVGNTSDFYGGGLAHSTARRCRIFGNRVSLSRPNDRVPMPLSGGGADSSTLVDCLVANNLVEDATEEKTLTCMGGGTHMSTLYNCTVVGNEVHGGTQAEGGGVGRGGSVYNTVVYGNRVSVASETGNVSGDNVGYVLETVNSLVGVDPLFVDTGSGDYHLATGSPCIDSGSNVFVKGDFDLDGNARIQHDTVDIGCYEYALSTPVRDAAADFAAQMAGTCHGVFVGVDEYAHASSLAGCVPDATNMQTRCVAKGYWHKTNTIAFLDASATKAAVRAHLAALAAKAVAGDTVLYYQSSHGGNHTANGELTKDAYICLHDANYEDYEMAADLMRFAAGVKVVVVLDTCHSAGMFKTMDARRTTADMSFAQRVHQLMVARTALRKGEMSGITADDIGWIAAADYNQYSWDTAQGGAFTLALLDGWKTGEADADGDGRLNFHELWHHAKRIATGYSGADATDAQCLNEEVLLSRFAGFPDSVDADTVTVTTPVPVPHVWLDAYSELLAASDGDYEALANAQSPGLAGTGKNWPDGTPCSVWQDFVVGTSPTNDVLFTATIRLNGTKPVIEWVPDTPALRATRVYRTFGKKTLLDADWTELTDEDSSAYRFFKVTVDLP